MRMITYAEARSNLKQLIDGVVGSSAETVITSESGKNVVLMSLGGLSPVEYRQAIGRAA